MASTGKARAAPRMSPAAALGASRAMLGSGHPLQLVSKQGGFIKGEPRPGAAGGRAIVDPYYQQKAIVDPYYREEGIVDLYYRGQGIIDPAFLSGIIDPAFSPAGLVGSSNGAIAGEAVVAPSFSGGPVM